MSTEWHRIKEKSPPKDGTKIMVWANGSEWPEAIYYELYDDDDLAKVAGEPGFWRYAEQLVADWADVDFETLTHWAPIVPPKQEA